MIIGSFRTWEQGLWNFHASFSRLPACCKAWLYLAFISQSLQGCGVPLSVERRLLYMKHVAEVYIDSIVPTMF